MDKYDYILHLHELYHSEALRKHWQLHSDVQMEWAELQQVLHYAVAVRPLIKLLEELYYQTNDDSVKDRIVSVAEQVGFKESMIDIEPIEAEGNCVECGVPVTIPEMENYLLTEYNVVLICNTCLQVRQHEQKQEREQLAKYRFFVKEKDLENAFELYLSEEKFRA